MRLGMSKKYPGSYPLGLSRMDWVIRTEMVRALNQTQTILRAAEYLGLGRQTMYNKMRDYHITKNEWKLEVPIHEWVIPVEE